MRIIILFTMILISSALSSAQPSTGKTETNPNQTEQVIRQNYLTFCHQRVQTKHSLKNARTICQCALAAILKHGTMSDVAILSRESPTQLTEETESQKQRNERLIDLSNLEVHSLDDCESSLR